MTNDNIHNDNRLTFENFVNSDVNTYTDLIDALLHDTDLSYQLYSEYMSKNRIPRHLVQDKLTWIQFLHEIKDKEDAVFHDPTQNLGFSRDFGINAGLAGLAVGIDRATRIGKSVRDGFDSARKAGKVMKDAGEDMRDIYNSMTGGGARKGGGRKPFRTGDINFDIGKSVPTSGLPGDSGGNTPIVRFFQVPPVESRMSTGVSYPGFPKFYQNGLDETAPLAIKYGVPYLISDQKLQMDPVLFNYFDSVIRSQWYTHIADPEYKVRYSQYYNDLLKDKTKMINWFNIITYSLSVFYFYVAVRAHAELPTTKSDAITMLYKQMDPNDLLQLGDLKLALESIVIPPNLNASVHYLYDNFKQVDLGGSPTIRFSPIKFADNSSDNYVTQLENNVVTVCLNLLRENDFREVTALMARVCPAWRLPQIRGYSGMTKHDPSFSTIFQQASFVSFNKSHVAKALPRVTSKDDPISINVYTEDPDQIIAAHQQVYDETAQERFGGLLTYSTLTGTAGVTYNTTFTAQGVNQDECPCTEFIYTTHNDLSGNPVTAFFPSPVSGEFGEIIGNATYYSTEYDHENRFQRYGSTRIVNTTGKDMRTPSMMLMDDLFMPNSGSATVRLAGSDDNSSKKKRFYGKKKRSMKEE